MRIAVVSGGFDPLHSGHINYLQSASKHGNKLVVLVNSDEWLSRKKGRPFMPFEERSLIIQRMDMVDNMVITKNMFSDRTSRSVNIFHQADLGLRW